MVTINILVEGGIGANDPQQNNPKVLNNHNLLRQAFTRLFSKFTNQSIKTIIHLMGPVSTERSVNANDVNFYWRDLDRPPSEQTTVRQNVIQNIPSLQDHQIYFFVQEIEAWIISQLGIIQSPLYTIDRNVLNHSEMTRYNHPSEIPIPSEKLLLLSRLFIKENRKRDKRFAYAKLKNSHEFIELLDVEQLKQDFEDANRFSNILNELW